VNLPAILDELNVAGELSVNVYPQREELPHDLTLREFQALPATPDQLTRRAKIYALQISLTAMPGADTAGPAPLHILSPGMYLRQLTIPASTVVVSKRHARQHLCVISKGEALVFTEDGMTLIRGPHAFVSRAGAKRVLLVTDEIVWATVHRTECTTVEDAERDVLMDEQELLQ
jgi:hypothetical protein